jgi:anhydro-N-acetylmuramic acid kinase
MNKHYQVIGLMSGTSLDGLDIAFCDIYEDEGNWGFRIIAAETLPYPDGWKERLSRADSVTAEELAQLDVDYGTYSGRLAKAFILKYGIQPDFIASHGHTIFHQPEKKLTLQIGKGSAIAVASGLPVVNDFRSLDVALGGQGAPLVPIGDRLLFGEYDYCLNLGGFGNISFERDGERAAYDICPVNIVLNQLSAREGRPFDNGGGMARSGKADTRLLERLNSSDYYNKPYPKSLGREWVEREFLPVIESSELNTRDIMATLCDHIALQVARAASHNDKSSILVTGGGAFNGYLMDRIRAATEKEIMIPDPLTVNFKEALVFALLGVLRIRGENNCLRSVTGAEKDNCGGSIWV